MELEKAIHKIYNYADIAYVGGAMGNTGLHNTLEAAVFGIPIIIGENYQNFPEAKAMIANNGMFSIKNKEELSNRLEELTVNKSLRETSGKINRNHCFNSDPKRSHSFNLGTVAANFCDKSVHSFALDVIVCCKR